MTALVVFDIEAVPDLAAARRLLAQPDSTPDAEIRRMLGERYSRDGEDPATVFLKVPIYRIVSIAALNAKREDGGGPWTVTQIGTRSVGEKTEAEVLLGFVKALPVDGRGTGPILVTFGGNGFDLPLLRYRAFALGVPVPGLHGGGHRDYCADRPKSGPRSWNRGFIGDTCQGARTGVEAAAIFAEHSFPSSCSRL